MLKPIAVVGNTKLQAALVSINGFLQVVAIDHPNHPNHASTQLPNGLGLYLRNAIFHGIPTKVKRISGSKHRRTQAHTHTHIPTLRPRCLWHLTLSILSIQEQLTYVYLPYLLNANACTQWRKATNTSVRLFSTLQMIPEELPQKINESESPQVCRFYISYPSGIRRVSF